MEISILISQYAKRFPVSSWMFAVSIAFVFVKPHIENFTPPIPKKMSRVIFFFFSTELPQLLRPWLHNEQFTNSQVYLNSFIHLEKACLIVTIMHASCMKFDFLWFDRSTAYTLENEQGDIFFFQTKLPQPFNQYFNYVILASLTLNFLRFLSEVSLSVHLPAFDRVRRESYLSLIC